MVVFKKTKMDLRERFLGEYILEEMKWQVVGIKAHCSSNKTNILFINKTKLITRFPGQIVDSNLHSFF